MIQFACPGCGQALQAQEEVAGARTRCPRCRAEVAVPPAAPPVRAEAAAPAEAALPPPLSTEPPGVVYHDYPGQAPGEPGAAVPPEIVVPGLATDVTEYGPVRPRFSFLATLFGLAGAGLLAAGGFYPLVVVAQETLQIGELTTSVDFKPYWEWPVKIGGILLGVTVLWILISRRYGRLWLLGLGTLLATAGSYGYFFHVRVKQMVEPMVQEALKRATDPAVKQQIVEEGARAAKCLQPGWAFAFFGAGAVAVILAALLGRRRSTG
jgi:hypothetical protein